MPGDVITSTLLPLNNKLVMEENEREELKRSHLVSNALIKHDKKVILNSSRLEEEDKDGEKGAGDSINLQRDMGTLPVRTALSRTIFEEKTLKNRLTTIALVEKPKFQVLDKKEFEQRRKQISTSFVDMPDSAGISEIPTSIQQSSTKCLNPMVNENKLQPSFVNLPDVEKSNKKGETIELTNLDEVKGVISELQNQTHESDKNLADGQVISNKSEDESENKEDDDCLVNCIYYTQQFCECSIL